LIALQCASWALQLCPPKQRLWAEAMVAEVKVIPDDYEALSFAAGCLRAVMGLAVAHAATPLRVGLVCGCAATLLGCVVMSCAGAPQHYALLNGASLLLACGALASRPARTLAAAHPLTPLACGLALLATALFGLEFNGSARWLVLGSFRVQPALVLIPMMAVNFAGQPRRASELGVSLAALALALQADPSMATGLLVALMPVALRARSRGLLIWLVLTWAVALHRSSSSPQLPFVDGVVATAFDSSFIEGAALCAGLATLVAPAVWFRTAGGESGSATLASFGRLWGVIVVISLVGHGQAPLVSFGGSAILGYFLSVAALPPPNSLAFAATDA
jgi:hypothetical protein